MDKELMEQIADLKAHRESLDKRHSRDIAEIDRSLYQLRLQAVGFGMNNKPLKGRSKHDAAIQLKAYTESIDAPVGLDEALMLVDVLTKGLDAGKNKSLVYQTPEELIILYNNLTVEELENRLEQNLMQIAMARAEKNAREKGNYTPIKKPRVVSYKGARYHFTNLKAFCKDHELSYRAMRKVLSGEQGSHKGFKLDE